MYQRVEVRCDRNNERMHHLKFEIVSIIVEVFFETESFHNVIERVENADKE